MDFFVFCSRGRSSSCEAPVRLPMHVTTCVYICICTRSCVYVCTHVEAHFHIHDFSLSAPDTAPPSASVTPPSES